MQKYIKNINVTVVCDKQFPDNETITNAFIPKEYLQGIEQMISKVNSRDRY